MAHRVSSPVFIGRQVELARIDALRSQASQGGIGAVVLVSGEAGIGKSRFCAEIGGRAAADGWTVLRGACDEFGATARPFSPLAEMVPALSAAIKLHAPDEFARPAWRVIQALATGDKQAEDKGSVIHLSLDLFRRLTARVPVVVVVDDLHWADESTRGLFGTLARGLGGCPAILVGAYRGDEVDRTHPLRAVLSAVHRNGTPEVVELSPLERDEAQLLANAIGGGRTSAEFDEVFERSEGNAFFLEELLAAPAGTVPQGVRETVFARLSALETDAILVAEIASLDTSLRGDVLATVSGLGLERFWRTVDGLTNSGILVNSDGRYEFRHALMREVVDQTIPPGRRVDLHRRLAQALEEYSPAGAGAIARHWRESGSKPQALNTAILAARQAFELGAMPESANWFEEALELWRAVPHAEEATGTNLWDLVFAADAALEESRRFGKAITLLEGLLNGTEIRTATERALLWAGISHRAWQTSGDEATTLPKAFDALFRSVDALDNTVPLNVRIRTLCSFAAMGTLKYGLEHEAAAAFESAQILGAQRRDRFPMLTVAQVSLFTTTGADGAEDAIRNLATLAVVNGQAHRPIFLHMLGHHEECRRAALSELARLETRGRLQVLGTVVEDYLSRSLAAAGRWSEALEHFRAVRERLGPHGRVEWATVLMRGWGPLLVRTGQGQEAREVWDHSKRWILPYRMGEFIGTEALVRVELARASRDPLTSRQAASEALAGARGHHIAECGEAVAFAIGLEADFAFDESRATREVLDVVEGWIRRLRSCLEGAPGRVRLFDLGMFLDQAEAERSRFLGEDTAEVWEALAERWRELPRPYHEAYCRYRAAFALLMAPVAAERRLARERAAQHLQTALTISQELGAIYHESDIVRLRQTSGLRPRTSLGPVASAGVATPNAPALTSREVEVLRLLVAGESNGQIAIRLGISVKTASVHVSNILRKLDAENRVEAAVRASRMGIAGLR